MNAQFIHILYLSIRIYKKKKINVVCISGVGAHHSSELALKPFKKKTLDIRGGISFNFVILKSLIFLMP